MYLISDIFCVAHTKWDIFTYRDKNDKLRVGFKKYYFDKNG